MDYNFSSRAFIKAGGIGTNTKNSSPILNTTISYHSQYLNKGFDSKKSIPEDGYQKVDTKKSIKILPLNTSNQSTKLIYR